MNCPYCNNEMIKGVIQGDRRAPLKWMEDRGKMGLLDRMEVALDSKNIIAKNNLMHKATKEAYRCNLCNKIIIDLE